MLKIRDCFVSNSSSSSFILSKKDISLEQIRGFTSWVNIYNEQEYGDGANNYVTETSNYFFGSVSYSCGIKEQLTGLNIKEDQYDLEG